MVEESKALLIWSGRAVEKVKAHETKADAVNGGAIGTEDGLRNRLDRHFERVLAIWISVVLIVVILRYGDGVGEREDGD